MDTATVQASDDCQEQELNTRRPKDLQHMGPRRSGRTKSFAFRTPLLFVDKFWNITITGITSGWNFSIRSYNVIPDGSAIITHCEDGNIEEIQRLFDDCLASPFDCDERGRTLLHIAAESGQVEACKFLLQNGADPTVREALGLTPLELGDITISMWAEQPHNPVINDLYRLLLRDNEDVMLEKPDSTWVGKYWFQGPPEAFTLIQESLFVNYSSLPLEFRFRRAMSLVSSTSVMTSPDMLRIAMGGDRIDPSAYHLIDKDGKSLLFRIVEFMGMEFPRLKEDSISAWRELLREAIQAGANLCQISTDYAPLIKLFRSRANHLWDIKRAIYTFNHTLQRWALELQAAGADLAVYGAEESARSGAVDRFVRLFVCSSKSNPFPEEWLDVHLLSLSYGPNPEDWHVWVSNPVDELVEDFWEMIERKEEIMPGAWVE